MRSSWLQKAASSAGASTRLKVSGALQISGRASAPSGGLHAGVLAAKGNLIFVSACDMPCLETAVVSHLFDAIGDADAAIPCWNPDMLEPLHAVYRRDALLRYLESHESYSLRPMIRSLNSRYVPVEELRRFDPSLRTFTNINKLEELDRINALADNNSPL